MGRQTAASSICSNYEDGSKKKFSGKVAPSKECNDRNNIEGGLTLPVAVLLFLLSFAMGVLTPPFLSLVVVMNTDSIRTSKYVIEKLLPSSWGVSSQLKAELHGRGGCIRENLADFLHEGAVPGLHTVCVVAEGQGYDIALTMYPGSQVNNSFTRKTHNNWEVFRALLTEELNLKFYNEFTKETTEKWTIYTPNGDKIVSVQELISVSSETYSRGIMEKIIQEGMVLIYQGGAFVWPGVRTGFERNIKLDVPILTNDNVDVKVQQQYYVTLKTLSLTPLVISVENFLTKSECDHIKTQATPRMRYSDVSLMDKDKGKAASEFRTSQSTFLPSKSDLILQNIDQRVASLTRLPRDHQEMVQVLRYGMGGMCLMLCYITSRYHESSKKKDTLHGDPQHPCSFFFILFSSF
jgi:hypothetical protein